MFSVEHILEILEANKHTSLYICASSNNLSVEEVNKISKALEKNTSLTRFYLYDNKLDQEKVKYISQAIEKNTTLTYIYIYGNNLRQEIRR